MPKKKPVKKTSEKKKSANRKKISPQKKPIQRKKPKRSKRSSVSASAQIHQGTGAATVEAGVPTNDVPEHDVASKYGGES
jgi:hypothetical protein